MPYRLTKFRTIVVKLYYAVKLLFIIPLEYLNTANLKISIELVLTVLKKGYGRPKKNITFLIEKEKSNFNLALKLR